MTKTLLVGLGGFLGSVLRFLLGGVVQGLFRSASFPIGTLAVNALGCFAIGALSEVAETRGILSDRTRAFAVIGVLGGFTTFSAFSNETLNLFRDGQGVPAAANVVAQVGLGLAAVWVGRVAAYALWR